MIQNEPNCRFIWLWQFIKNQLKRFDSSNLICIRKLIERVEELEIIQLMKALILI